MFWEIIVSNLITTCIVGGGIAAYHYYRVKKEQEYYNMIRTKVNDDAVAMCQGIVSYLALKGYSEVTALKVMIENHPEFKNKIIPWEVVDGVVHNGINALEPQNNWYESKPIYAHKMYQPKKFMPSKFFDGSKFCNIGNSHINDPDGDLSTIDSLNSFNSTLTEKLEKSEKYNSKKTKQTKKTNKAKNPKVDFNESSIKIEI